MTFVAGFAFFFGGKDGSDGEGDAFRFLEAVQDSISSKRMKKGEMARKRTYLPQQPYLSRPSYPNGLHCKPLGEIQHVSHFANQTYIPICSVITLRRMGFPHSLHLTTPMSEVDDRGCGPNNFMSRAESHDVGGEGSEVCSDGGGDGSRASQEK